MVDQVEIQAPKTRWNEESAFTVTAYFRDRATQAASIPTTIHYRVDCLTTKRVLKDWTSVSSPAASNTISLTSDLSKIYQDHSKIEKKQIIVQADRGLSGQATGKWVWIVDNLHGIGGGL